MEGHYQIPTRIVVSHTYFIQDLRRGGLRVRNIAGYMFVILTIAVPVRVLTEVCAEC